MFRNYITIIWRNLNRNKLFSFIHIMGLSLGLACALFMGLLIFYEYSFDDFHEKIDRIYLLRKTIYMEAQDYTVDKTGDAYGDVLRSTFSGIETNTRFRNPGELLFNIKSDNENLKAFLENDGAAVDTSFLSIFTFPVINGHLETALEQKHSILLCKSAALRLFGSTDCVGKEITVNENHSLKVTAVLEDVNEYSTLKFDWVRFYCIKSGVFKLT